MVASVILNIVKEGQNKKINVASAATPTTEGMAMAKMVNCPGQRASRSAAAIMIVVSLVSGPKTIPPQRSRRFRKRQGNDE